MTNRLTDNVRLLKRYDLTANDIKTYLEAINYPHADILTQVSNDTTMIEVLEMLIPYPKHWLTYAMVNDIKFIIPSEIYHKAVVVKEYWFLYITLMQILINNGFYDIEGEDKELKTELNYAHIRYNHCFDFRYLLN